MKSIFKTISLLVIIVLTSSNSFAFEPVPLYLKVHNANFCSQYGFHDNGFSIISEANNPNLKINYSVSQLSNYTINYPLSSGLNLNIQTFTLPQSTETKPFLIGKFEELRDGAQFAFLFSSLNQDESLEENFKDAYSKGEAFTYENNQLLAKIHPNMTDHDVSCYGEKFKDKGFILHCHCQ